MLAVIILLGAAYTQQVKGHVAVDFLTSRFTQETQAVLQVITTIGQPLHYRHHGLAGVYLGAWRKRRCTDQLRIPNGPFKMLVAVGGLLLWLQLVLRPR